MILGAFRAVLEEDEGGDDDGPDGRFPPFPGFVFFTILLACRVCSLLYVL
jgi:hypothetical protein